MKENRVNIMKKFIVILMLIFRTLLSQSQS